MTSNIDQPDCAGAGARPMTAPSAICVISASPHPCSDQLIPGTGSLRSLERLAKTGGSTDATARRKQSARGGIMPAVKNCARKPVWPLRHRRVVLWKVVRRPVGVLVTGKDHERIAKKTNDIVARQADAAEPVRVAKVERRQGTPSGIGGSDGRENARRLRRQEPIWTNRPPPLGTSGAD